MSDAANKQFLSAIVCQHEDQRFQSVSVKKNNMRQKKKSQNKSEL